ncbi:SET domain-containing protein [Pseudovirgaria hyperparasitica]|uniref:SET domain-containing protein n=1 Tax=Pseudovirgaria hyperparasitica TaxID=470096 RepID=A0A6A6VVU2_9PEZI|nr:SET domain-containing protein [Pseudovirgaria hyperparasitica]KAF2753367.1 SET domain-containing protein [Pseudovirgaria hyperparasitica]
MFTALLPPGTPFEIRASPGRRLGVFATKDIPAKSCIFREEALFVIKRPFNMIGPEDVDAAYRQLDSRKQALFKSLVEYERHQEGQKHFFPQVEAFKRNQFDVSGQMHDYDQPIPHAQGLFLISSRLNHSCIPNAVFPRIQPKTGHGYRPAVLLALRPIAIGEEILFDYDPAHAYLTAKQRRAVPYWKFTCTCAACDDNYPQRVESDMRRALLRGLHYLIHRRDVPECSRLKPPVLQNATSGRPDPNTIAMWQAISGYIAEAEGLAMLAIYFFYEALKIMISVSGSTAASNRGLKLAVVWGEKFLAISETLHPDAVEGVGAVEQLMAVFKSMIDGKT